VSTIIVVDNDLDTLLTALYVFLDDHVIGPRRVGRPPWLTDAELLCLAIAQVLLNFPNERQWVRYARKNLRALFPYIPDQSGYNKRLRAAGPMISKVIRALARTTPTSAPILRLVDSTPVPCGASRETAQRSDLAGQDAGAGYGYCASHSRYFWGLRLHLLCTVHGLPIGFALTGAKADERATLLHILTDPTLPARGNQTLIADKNYNGREFEAALPELGITLLRPARKGERDRPGARFFKPLRQIIESINDTLKGQLNLEQHGGRTIAGVLIRVWQRLLALTAAVWHNDHTHQPVKRSLIAYDH